VKPPGRWGLPPYLRVGGVHAAPAGHTTPPHRASTSMGAQRLHKGGGWALDHGVQHRQRLGYAWPHACAQALLGRHGRTMLADNSSDGWLTAL